MILVSGASTCIRTRSRAWSPDIRACLECAAVGVPDENSGEAVKLFVVKKDPALTERDVMDYCKEHLTGYKKPKYIEFRATCRRPMSARSCAANCATRRARRPRKHRLPRKAPPTGRRFALPAARRLA